MMLFAAIFKRIILKYDELADMRANVIPLLLVMNIYILVSRKVQVLLNLYFESVLVPGFGSASADVTVVCC